MSQLTRDDLIYEVWTIYMCFSLFTHIALEIDMYGCIWLRSSHKKEESCHSSWTEFKNKNTKQNSSVWNSIWIKLKKKKIISRELSLREAAVAAMIAEELVSFQHKLDYYWYLHNGNLLSLPSLWTDLQSIAFIYCTAFSV